MECTLEDIKAARDSGGFISVVEAVKFIRDKKENKISLTNGFEMRFHTQFRGFVVLPDATKPSEFHLICPVMSCEGYFGGGQKCVHFQQFLDEMDTPKETRASGVLVTEKFIRSVIEKIGFDENAHQAPGSYLNVLSNLEKSPYKSTTENFVASRFNNGMSVRVMFSNGLSFYTCGEGGCYKKAENLRDGSYYCPSHMEGYCGRTNPHGTANAFRNAFKKLAYKHDATVNIARIPSEIWTKCLADIYEQEEFSHVFEGSKVFIQFSDSGQLIYQNVHKKSLYRKCPLPNCLKAVELERDVNGKPNPSKLCRLHRNDELLLTALVGDVKKLVTSRLNNVDSSSAKLS